MKGRYKDLPILVLQHKVERDFDFICFILTQFGLFRLIPVHSSLVRSDPNHSGPTFIPAHKLISSDEETIQFARLFPSLTQYLFSSSYFYSTELISSIQLFKIDGNYGR